MLNSVGLTTHKWADSCPHKVIPVKSHDNFDKQNQSFQGMIRCTPAAGALPKATFKIQTKTLNTWEAEVVGSL